MKKLEVRDTNYAATIVRVGSTVKLEGLDNLVALPLFGFQALVPKSTQAGDLGVLFTAESQLSEDFCAKNNLFRHSEKNSDKDAKGYLEDNRRVKAIRLRGNTSSALFLPVSSLDYLGDLSFSEGDTFTHVNGVEVCCKFRAKQSGGGLGGFKKQKASRVIDKLFPKHFDTENFFRNYQRIPNGSLCVITQKIHGTSARFAHQAVMRELSRLERFAKWLGIRVPETEYAYFCGTRNTTKDPESAEDAGGYYKENLWSHWLEQIKHKIPKNWVVYGEIYGWTPNGSAIQKNYTYSHDIGKSSLVVYRVAVVNEDGVAVDLSWSAVKEWCKSAGLNHVAEIGTVLHNEPADAACLVDYVKSLMDLKYCRQHDTRFDGCVAIGDESPCDEGVCIRVDNAGSVPFILKAKSPLFLEHETKCIDKGEVDTEEAVNA